jgi:hypothetical protein
MTGSVKIFSPFEVLPQPFTLEAKETKEAKKTN